MEIQFYILKIYLMMVITILYNENHLLIMEIQFYTMKIFCNYDNLILYNKDLFNYSNLYFTKNTS